jgi:hypothetical protein
MKVKLTYKKLASRNGGFWLEFYATGTDHEIGYVSRVVSINNRHTGSWTYGIYTDSAKKQLHTGKFPKFSSLQKATNGMLREMNRRNLFGIDTAVLKDVFDKQKAS